ncbi:HAD family hydrolase [Kitasatospora purpeofusca]|uniref:HAD family hydrolase n=1 Tax=Kitasatospora purpeofusca TaxID=67352 RepID=UPI00386D2F44|nr:HAD-IA family hydrolase [Kitasatospora purpeofusca]
MDLDNTLINRNGAVADWVTDFSAAWGLSAEAVQALSTALRERATPDTFEGLRSTLGLAEPAVALWDSYVAGLAARVVCAPATLSQLDRLRAAGWSVGVLTNGATDVQRAKLTAIGILDRVDAVCISEEIGARKPEPEAFRVAVARFGGELPGDVWMVGDNPVTDIAGANAAGLRTIWISAGSGWSFPGQAPDHIAETAVDAADFLLGLPETSR